MHDVPFAGLSSADAGELLERWGPNEPITSRRQGVAARLLRQFANPLVLILLMAGAVSVAAGDVTNSVIIIGVVVLSAAIEYVQTHRSERSAEALRAKVAPTATVRRDGKWTEVARSAVVPGDLIGLSAGDLVPADARLLAAKDLHVQEAALTGESFPVEKAPAVPPPSDEHAKVGVHDADAVLMGSSVVSGMAAARVVATGPRTAFGEIAHQLAKTPPPSEFERGITRFGVFIFKTVFFLVLFVFAAAALQGKPPLESLLFAVALAVGLTPEFLPMITTVTLAKGAVRMAKSKVIVKSLGAIQNFGSIDVLCSDKTGTLTTGVMTLETHVDASGRPSERVLELACINSHFETGVDNPLDAAVLTKSRVDPLDSAVLNHRHADLGSYRKVDEIPFDFERRMVSVVVERAGERLVVTKGAPENVLDACASYEIDGVSKPLDEATRAGCHEEFEGLSKKGYRVIAVAFAHASGASEFTKKDEVNLTFAGFLGFIDPPRTDADQVLRALAADGVVVKVLTGDSELVAAHVCERVGLDTGRALLGTEIDQLSDPALAQRAEKARLFARVNPAQKTRILRALRSRGHVVGFLGDGINDAPSLRVADVGISVDGAVDVAKDAADVILLEPSLRALLEGIREGRKAYGNVMKYLLMGTSSNFGNMFSMAAAVVVLPFLPMLPTQILLNNFLYDLAQITIPSDNVDESFVEKPRRWDIDLIRRFMIWIGPLSSLYDFLTFYVLLRVFHAGERVFHTGWFIESLGTQTLVIFVIRTMQNPFKSRPSPALAATTTAVVAGGVLLCFTSLGAWLGFEPLPASYFLFLVPATATYLVLVELLKRRVMARAFT